MYNGKCYVLFEVTQTNANYKNMLLKYTVYKMPNITELVSDKENT